MSAGSAAPPLSAIATPQRGLVVIPAFNEAASLPAVIADLREHLPDVEILVVDDGSTDDTRAVLRRMAVRWIGLPTRSGPGAAVRAGLRYACLRGFDVVVRVDGDGQHPGSVVRRVLGRVMSGEAEVAIGSRFLASGGELAITMRRGSQYLLGRILSVLTGSQVTDPTSGLWAFGPRAVRLLRDHHPSGYPEPELLLFLSRNHLPVVEVPVRMRDRLAGRTSLTASRTGFALARLVLLLVVVPLRASVGASHD